MRNLVTVEYKEQRILTTQQLADNYKTDARRISENFNRNEERYIVGKHYYLLEGNELKAFKSEYANCGIAENINKLYLWTEKGALLHAKSLNTDVAWQVYEMLVENYFDVNPIYVMPQIIDSKFLFQIAQKVEAQEKIIAEQKDIIEEQKPKVDFADRVLKSKDVLLIREFAKIMYDEQTCNFGEKKMYAWLRANGYLMKNNEPYQQYCKYFQVEERTVDTPFGTRLVKTTKITPCGQLYIYNKLKTDTSIIPSREKISV